MNITFHCQLSLEIKLSTYQNGLIDRQGINVSWNDFSLSLLSIVVSVNYLSGC